MIAVYVHIPFCESKCSYCAFPSYVACDNIKKKYFKFLSNEIENCKFHDRDVVSIYFGGGTPSCVDVDYIATVMQTIKKNFNVLDQAEITIECNPCSVDFDKLKKYFQLGFNRLSFGVQSLNKKMLKLLGRKHNKKQVFSAIKNSKLAGFKNISVDFLLGLPKGDVVADAKKMLHAGVKHISAYMLQLENGTPLKQMVNKNLLKLPSDEQVVKKYNKLVKFLTKKNLYHYEISNFAYKNFQSVHNFSYWTGQAYMGFGLGAHSFDGKNTRWANADSFEQYFAHNVDEEVLSLEQRDEEIIMLGLRCCRGFNLQDLSFDLQKSKEYNLLLKENIISLDGSFVKLNPRYYDVSNSIILKLLNN